MKPIHKKFLVTITILWAMAVATFAGLHFLLLSPQKEAMLLVNEKLAQKVEELEQYQAVGLPGVRIEWDERIETMSANLGQYVANPQNLDRLAFSISRIANEIGVKGFSSKELGEKSYAEMPNYDYIGRSSTSVSFIGTFNQLAQFINALERHGPVVFLDEFTISKVRRVENESQVHILYNMYVRMENEEVVPE
ncbi:MAG: hypothetical protein KAR47_15305 [Planctomycetes bacterium]|nr:hypothetical protein [Planctomycetota bacterium]